MTVEDSAFRQGLCATAHSIQARTFTQPWHGRWNAPQPRTMRFASILILSLTLLFSPLLADDSAPESTPELVTSVAVQGSTVHVPFTTQVGQPIDTEKVEDDVHQLWHTGRFDDIRVETQKEEQGTAVIFHVVESHPMQLHEFRMEPSTFGLQFTLPEGSPMNALRAHQIALQAQQQLQEQGFRDAHVDYRLVPFAGKQVDLRLNIKAGDRIKVKQITFTGDTKLDPKELRGALQDLKSRRILPPLPAAHSGFTLFAGYSPEATQNDLGRIRSLYLTKGYYDATVRLDDVEIHGKEATLRIAADAGPKFQVRNLEVDGAPTPPANLCLRLFQVRREAEKQGILDFATTLRVGTDQTVSEGDPVADLTASVERGRPYQVGKIEFYGNHSYSEAFMRRNFLLDEGDVLDERLLRKSIERLNETQLFQPISERNTVLHTDPETGIADISVQLVQRKRNSWRISGPIGPPSFAGDLEGSVSSRLPSWGSGFFELSTYTASISMFAFAGPLAPYLFIGSKLPIWLPILSLRRQYSPGDGWLSGFTIAPQLGWEYLFASYAVGQLEHRLVPLLNGDRGLVPELPVTVETPSKGSAVMFCEPPSPRFSYLRTPATFVLRFAGGFMGL